MDHGDIRLGDTLDVKFTTRRFTTGAPFTLAGSPVISAYVGNGTTEITAGITLTVDFDSRTGLNNVRVVASSGNGFATATNVQLVITTGTVDSVSVVGEVIGSFSIEARSAVMPTVVARTLGVESSGKVNVLLADTVTTYTGNTPQTGDNFARIGAAGASLTDLGGMSTTMKAQVQVEAEDGLVAKGLDHLVSASVTGTDITDNSIIARLVSKSATADWDSFVNTTDALEAIRDKETDIETDTAEIGAAGAGLTNINLPNQTMDIVGNITGNLSGSIGSYTGNTPQTGDVFPLASTEIADIKAKTDALPSDPADASVVAGLIAALEAKVDIIDITADAILVDTAEIGAAGVGLTAAATAAIQAIRDRISPIVTKTCAVVADGGNSATTFVTDLTESTDDYWKDSYFRVTSGALINQVKKCTAYNGTTKALTVLGGYTGTPANGVTLEVVND